MKDQTSSSVREISFGNAGKVRQKVRAMAQRGDKSLDNSKAWNGIDISVYVQAGRRGVSAAVGVLFSEQHFLLTFLSFCREFFFLFEKHNLEINVFTLHYIFGFKHFTMGKLVK